ncbi:carbohydrate-binding module family 32 [Sporormia fimetaria CBS 119925]|uniref:Carbohydrate-binding module family 32 n=1 Tax=Sporormia fimetaria CBS 119925 TaxID=1340428 RepID=A0A6A6UYV7_9PLEO|nr:carbohydrate-binding module family 32 [Sporormia fimetaria CBS 119925]
MELITLLLYLCSFLSVVNAASVAVSRAGWSASSDSSQTGSDSSRVLDGSSSTIWISADTALPHFITIDMKTSYLVNGVSIQPRQDGSANGRIGQHKIELSADGSSWTQVAVGTYVNSATTKKTTFVARPGRYLRITALTEAQSATNQLTSIAEVNVFADVKFLSKTGWTVTADSEETSSAAAQAAKAIDGNTGTIWHTKYSGTVAPLPHWFRIDQGTQVTVAGLSYLPRQDGGNGRIGGYNVQASNDSTTWTIVASGTWADNGEEKVAQFRTRARYFRLNALTEAGARGQWSSAAEINLLDTTAPTYTAPVATKGIWANTVDFPIVPAAAAVLPNGKVFLWSAYQLDNFGGSNGYTQFSTYDPGTASSTSRTVTNTQHDMFCPGISMDFNGRIIVTGGSNAAKTSIYDVANDAWLAAANMQVARGYQSTATTSEGKVFNIGGSWSGGQGNKNGEIYVPSSNTWALIQNALVSPMLTNDRGGVYRADNHAWLFGWKNGTVFQAGPSKAMNWYNTIGTGSTTGAGNRATDLDSMNGNAIMYDAVAGKILTAGGASHYQTEQARPNAYVITINTPGTTPTVSATASMSFSRGFANGVVLPDGTVFMAGGQSFVEPFSDATAILIPELWNPSTGTWTQMNPMAIPRTYHSVGLLLPDATVLISGGGLCGGCGTNHWDGEIFVPPYLLNSDGTRRARPAITTAAATVRVGATLSITTSGTVATFSLVRLGTATHTVNTDQRRVPLTASGSGTAYTVTIPSDPGVALPGYWLLFAINSAGTPSVGRMIKVLP